MKIPINIRLIPNYVGLIYILKQIKQMMFGCNTTFNIQVMFRFLTNQIYQIVLPHLIKLKEQVQIMMKKKKQDQYVYDCLSALNLIMFSMQGVPTEMRILVIDQALNFSRNLFGKQIDDLQYLVKKIRLIVNFQEIIKERCRVDFMYWTQELIPSILQYFYTNNQQLNMLQSYIDGLCDSIYLFESGNNKNEYKEMIVQELKDNILDKLAIEIEDFTRLYLSHINIDQFQGINPFQDNVVNIKQIMDLKKIDINDVQIDILFYLECQLNKKFYNINVMNLQDTNNYNQMKIICHQFFGISLKDVQLPFYDSRNSIDLFKIIKNISKFTTLYAYDIYQQSFEELDQPQKLRKVINQQIVQQFILSHGQGTITTTVNQIYLFIYKKFKQLIQFLCDELIHSLFQQEYMHCQEQKKFSKLIYSFENAENLQNQIESINEDGLNYLQKYRQLITQVGNSLGLLRLFKTAQINVCCRNSQNYKSFETHKPFQIYYNSVDQSLKQSLQIYDEQLSMLKSNFQNQTDYFAVIIQGFDKIISQDLSEYLQNFYLSVPCLQVNHINCVIQGIENKKYKVDEGNYTTNDGFILGIAFFLKLLNQNSQFNLLNWDKEIINRFRSREQKDDTSQAQQVFLSKQKQQKKEFEILFNSFEVARQLFK